MTSVPPPLRAYQAEAFSAILRAAEAHDAGLIVVRMSRQSGKNEISARVEASLLAVHHRSPRSGVKAAPTQEPQAIRSLKRLAAHLRRCGFVPPLLAAGDATVRLGAAEWWFGSGEPGASVVGGTADLLLEFDEAQDFDIAKHDQDYRPMAAATAAASVYYGTALTSFDLLETTRERALDLERRDGERRVFDVPWSRVAEEVPAYGRFVVAERDRLGHTPEKPHPVFQTQYELLTVAGAGRFLTPAQLDALEGDHAGEDGPRSESHAVYVAGLDVGGANLSGAEDPDETVLTIARARFPGRGRVDLPTLDVVHQYAWQGLDHDAARGEMLGLLQRWRVAHVVVDATGIGEPIATYLLGQLGERKVTAFKFSRPSKSSLGYDFLAAVNTGAVRLWRPDPESAHAHAALSYQLRQARRELKPGGGIDYYVAPADGHDDRLISLALCVRAASRGRPRIARQREAS